MLILPSRDEFLFYSERELDVELDVIGQPWVLSPLLPVIRITKRLSFLVSACISLLAHTTDALGSVSSNKHTLYMSTLLAGGEENGTLVCLNFFIGAFRVIDVLSAVGYFTQETIDNLYTIDDFPELASLQVPPGKFRSARCVKGRPKDTSENAGPYSSNQARSPKYAPYLASNGHHPSPLDPPAWPKAPHDLTHGKLGSSRFSSTPDGAQVLAPLAFLETTHIPKRHPIDDRALRSFTVS